MSQKKSFEDLYVIAFKGATYSLAHDGYYETKEIAKQALEEMKFKNDYVVISVDEYFFAAKQEEYNDGYTAGWDSAYG